MEQYFFDPALLRAIERLIAVLLGGVAIILGYKLFMNVPQATDSSAKIDISGKVKVILTRIGPGVFFALFGAGIICASYYYQVTAVAGTTIPDKRDTVGKDGRYYIGASEQTTADEEVQESRLAEVRRAIRTMNQLLLNANARERNALRAAIETSKFALVCLVWQDKWGKPEVFKKWLNERGPMPASCKEPLELYELSVE